MGQQDRGVRRNTGYFFRFVVMLACIIVLFSVLFHFIMLYEAYKALKGNSFIDKIYEEIHSLDIVS